MTYFRVPLMSLSNISFIAFKTLKSIRKNFDRFLSTAKLTHQKSKSQIALMYSTILSFCKRASHIPRVTEFGVIGLHQWREAVWRHWLFVVRVKTSIALRIREIENNKRNSHKEYWIKSRSFFCIYIYFIPFLTINTTKILLWIWVNRWNKFSFFMLIIILLIIHLLHNYLHNERH